jgi:hypothetical protein
MSAKQSTPQVSPTEKIQAATKKLLIAAKDLNTASDELGKAITVLDAVLRKLNLGVSAWVTLSGDESPEGDFWSRDIGYAKIRGSWGIALRDVSGHFAFPEEEKVEEWPFNEGPRWMRADAIGKIPDLLEKMLKQAEETTKKIKAKTAQAFEIGEAISKVIEEAASPAQEREAPHAQTAK